MPPLPPTYQNPVIEPSPKLVSSGLAFVFVFVGLFLITCITSTIYFYFIRCKNWNEFKIKIKKQWRNVKLFFCCKYVRHPSNPENDCHLFTGPDPLSGRPNWAAQNPSGNAPGENENRDRMVRAGITMTR